MATPLIGGAMLAWLRLIGWAAFDALFFFSMRTPRLIRVGLGLFRRVRPVWKSPLAIGGKTILVTRADDVREVLGRANDFLLGPVNQHKILSGDFVISLDPERRYRKEKEEFRTALPPNRLKQLEDIVDATAQGLLRNPANPFQVVEYAERVTVAIVEEFWGLRACRATSKVVRAEAGADTLRLWLRKLAIVLGSREPAPFGIREVGMQCSEEFLSFVRAACASHPPNSPDMIGYLLARTGGDLEVTARNIAGMVMTGSAVVTKAFSHAFEQLVRCKEARDAATTIARASHPQPPTPAEREQIGRLMVEALRFNPVFPVLPRYCVRATTLAKGTPREIEVPAGANVIAGVIAAMFDPEALDQPDRFGVGRSLQFNRDFATDNWRYGSANQSGPGVYLLFGGGDHWCLGDQMAVAEMASMATWLLRALPDPAVTNGVRYDGSAAKSLLIRHGA